MKKILLTICLITLLTSYTALALNTEKQERAEALVMSTATYFSANGLEKTAKEISKDNSHLRDKELYVFLINYNTGIVAGHGESNSIIGRSFLNITDADGNLFLNEIIKVAKDKGEGWVEYKWPNPASKKIEQKISFIKRLDDSYLAGCGYYTLEINK